MCVRACVHVCVYSPEAQETVSPKRYLEGTKILSNNGAKKDFMVIMKYVINVN